MHPLSRVDGINSNLYKSYLNKMATKIRLQRGGHKGYAFYSIVIADVRAPRDGKFTEKIGTYNPNTNPATVDLNFERALYWVETGAQPTATARNILKGEGVYMMKHLRGGVKKGAFDEATCQQKFDAWKKVKDASKETLEKKTADAKKASAAKNLEEEKKVNEAIAKKIAEKKAAAKAAEEAAKAAEDKVTKDALELSDRLFQHFKDYEKLMEKQLEAAGRKSDPYRASKPDNYKDPEEPKKPDTPTVPEKPQIREDANKVYIPAPNYVATSSTRDIPANAEGNPNNRFGYAATANVQVFGQTSTRAEAPQVQSQASQEPSQAPQTTVANAEGNPNNRFGFAGNYEGGKDFKNIGTFSNGN